MRCILRMVTFQHFSRKYFNGLISMALFTLKKVFIKLTCQATLQSTSLEILYWMLKHKVWMDQPSRLDFCYLPVWEGTLCEIWGATAVNSPDKMRTVPGIGEECLVVQCISLWSVRLLLTFNRWSVSSDGVDKFSILCIQCNHGARRKTSYKFYFYTAPTLQFQECSSSDNTVVWMNQK